MGRSKLNIVHVDMDAFYAAVEEKDNPHLKGFPVIVGGRSRHGIVTTANYEARKYGIHSAMPIFKARQLCPHGVYIRPRMERYREVSKEIFEILKKWTPIIEKVSVDEAYLDIGSRQATEAVDYILDMKREVKESLDLTMSIGLSYNKFLAKIGSDWNKPNGFKIISEDMVPDILLPLRVQEVHGIGPKSAEKLNSIGVYKIEDLLYLEEDFLIDLFGKMGREVYYRIRGIDTREVDVHRERKSIGIERTFDENIHSLVDLKERLLSFSCDLSEELLNKELHCRTIVLKIKDEDFKTQTRSKTLEHPIWEEEDIYRTGLELLDEIDFNKEIRLLGVTGGNLISMDLEQLSLFNEED